MKPKQIIEMLRDAFRKNDFEYRRLCFSLAGDGNVQIRREIMRELTGLDLPKSKCKLCDVQFELRNNFNN